jgi:hypothetical protein
MVVEPTILLLGDRKRRRRMFFMAFLELYRHITLDGIYPLRCKSFSCTFPLDHVCSEIDTDTARLNQGIFSFVAAHLVRNMARYAAGSGISEIKCIIAGFTMKGFLGLMTLFIKSVTLVRVHFINNFSTYSSL